MTTGTVIVVGSINVDLVVTVERLPRAGETVAGGSFERHGGGKGANQAVAAARAGAAVKFVGAVGGDDLGTQALAELDDEGIDTSGVARVDDAPTGVAAIVVDAGGENQIAVASGANARLGGATVEQALASFDLPVDGVCLLNLEIPDAALVVAARCARGAGMRTIVVNPAPARRLPDGLIKLSPVLTPNAGEATALAGHAEPQAAAAALSRATRGPVIVTLGADGAAMVEGDKRARFGAPRAEAVDATGAGDAFNGALAAAIAQGAELAHAVPRAVAAATRSVQARGARSGMASRDEIDALVEQARA